MDNKPQSALIAATARILRPLVRILLRYGISYQLFSETARKVFVDVAGEDFTLPGRKPTNARVAMITGLNRKEVSRLKDLELANNWEEEAHYNRASRIISGWLRDKEFCGRQGKPLNLPLEGEQGSFAALVKRYSGDMQVRAVFDELSRVNAISKQDNGDVQLNVVAYVPAAGQTEKIAILGTDVADLIDTIDYNIDEKNSDSRFQLKTVYDNVPAEHAQAFKVFSDKKSHTLLKEFDDWLAAHDRDQNPLLEGDGTHRIGVGIYTIEECLEDQTGKKK